MIVQPDIILFLASFMASIMAISWRLICKGITLDILSMLEMRLDRNVPVASLAAALWIVSNIFSAFLLPFIIRNELYSSLYKMRDLCIVVSKEKEAP